MRTLLLIHLFLLPLLLDAQSRKLERARHAVAELDYGKATKLYLGYLNKQPQDFVAALELAECYFSLNQPLAAERWYAVAMEKPVAKPIHGLHYGMVLQANGKCNEALPWFERYSEGLPHDYRGRNLALSCRQQDVLMRKNEGLVEVYPLQSGLGTPTMVKNLNARANEVFVTLPFFNNNYRYTSPALSTDNQRLFFASNMPGGYGGLDLYLTSRNSDGQWGLPVNLGPEINTEGDENHPFPAAGNKLYFASNGHTGLGSLDIYYSTEKENGTWNKPGNPGYPINTRFDDFGLVMHENGQSGYFSSNRQAGAGGNDVYQFTQNSVLVELQVIDARRSEPVPGVHIYNPKSQVTLVADQDGHLNIDFAPGDCFNFELSSPKYDSVLFHFCPPESWTQQTRQFTAVVRMSKTIQVDVQGIVFDMVQGLPAKDALVTLYDENGNPTGDSLRTGFDGLYHFRLQRERCYTLQAQKPGYKTTAQNNVCSKGFEKSGVLKINLSLYPELDEDGFLVGELPSPELAALEPTRDLRTKNVVAKSPVVNDPTPRRIRENPVDLYGLSVSHGFDQSDVPEGELPVLEKLVELMVLHPDWTVEVVSHTDTRGSDVYNMVLSLRRAEAIGDWLVKHGIDRNRLLITALGESQPLFECGDNEPCTEAEHRANRRTEFRLIE